MVKKTISAPTFKDPESLSVVLPAHNEEKNIGFVLAEAITMLNELGIDYEIIVVDDGSSDNTYPTALAFTKRTKRLEVLRHEKNLGYGAALTTGFRHSKKNLVFFMDSDRQFSIRDITKLLPYVDAYDIVAGYRIKRNDPFHRVLIGRVYNLLVITLFGVYLKDIDCAFKIYHRDVIDNISFETIGALVNTEIMLKAKIMGKKVKEVGVNHYPRLAGEQSGARVDVITKAFIETLGLWWRYRLLGQVPKRSEVK